MKRHIHPKVTIDAISSKDEEEGPCYSNEEAYDITLESNFRFAMHSA
jgi:hypothetical protein